MSSRARTTDNDKRITNGKICVVGVGLKTEELPPTISRSIEQAEVLVGGERLLSRFQDHPAVKVPVKSPLEKVFQRIKKEREAGRRVVVLADGDPGFFGIGKRLVDAFGGDLVELYPNVTVLQVAAARMKMPWEDIKTVSLHGRQDMWPLLRALREHDLVAVLTDRVYDPSRIAEELIQRNAEVFQMRVFENLGEKEERIGLYGLHEAVSHGFSPLNFIILERIKDREIIPSLGLGDDFYVHERGLITKREIRAVGLSMLEIQPSHIVWDLGAGCGSVGIEASLLAHEGTVYCVEKEPLRAEMIRENIRRTGTYGVEVVHGVMPGCLKPLPDPDRIFVGGGIGHTVDMLAKALKRLKPGGKMVLHLVLMGSLDRARHYLGDMKYPYTLIQVQVSRSESLAGDERLEALNPVYVLSITKP